MYTVGLYTLGCKVSQYETEAIAEKFESCGFRVCAFEETNDVYVINTCTVTAESDRKCRQIIRRAAKKNPNAVIAVVGCYSQRSPEQILAIDGVKIVVGTQNKLSIVEKAIDALSARDKGQEYQKTAEVADVFAADFEPMKITKAPRTRAYVKIEDGCEARCTYCAISMARGRVRSKLPHDVIEEVRSLARTGVREVVLTGIETGSYGKDFDYDYRLADLICDLYKLGCCERIRLGSLAPELIGEQFVEKVKDVKILAPHFHLSLQSGSDKVLKDMKRRYTAARALENIERLRLAFPGANFTTDLMVGFPGETEEDFLLTERIVREARLLDAHVFTYSKRSGTPAASYPHQIPESEKKSRSERLIATKNEVRDSILSELVESKKPLSAILETMGADGLYTAHSDAFVELLVDVGDRGTDMCGQMVRVTPVSHKDGIVVAKLLL